MAVLWWLIISAITVFPLWVLLPRYRLPAPASLIAVIPFGVILLLYVMAFRDELKIPGIDT